MGRSNAISFSLISTALIVVALSWCGIGQSLAVDLEATGTVVAWVAGIGFQATISGGLSLAGEVVLAGETVPFSAEGSFLGFGVRDILTLITEGWFGLDALGQTSAGEPIEIHALLHARRKSLIPLRAGDVFLGEQQSVVLFRDGVHPFCGGLSGTAEGGLEPSDRPGTIQLGGTGIVCLTGDPRVEDSPIAIPLDDPALPPDFLQYLAELGFGG